MNKIKLVFAILAIVFGLAFIVITTWVFTSLPTFEIFLKKIFDDYVAETGSMVFPIFSLFICLFCWSFAGGAFVDEKSEES